MLKIQALLFTYYVSLIFADEKEFVLNGIEFTTIDGLRAFAFSKEAVEALAVANGYTDSSAYDVRFSFVPYGSDSSFDYGVTFTEKETDTCEHSYVNGACEICGEVENGSGSDAEFEAYKQNVIREISVQWKELTANLAVTESQYAYYDKYMITLESAQTAEEVANLQYQIEMLFDEIRNSGNEGGDVTGCEHSYVETRVNATCTADGYTEYRCTICGDAYTEFTEPAFGHSYLNGACEICGEVENGSGSDAEFEAYKQNVIREISVQWKELTANLAVTESQYAYYDKYMITLESAQTAEEVANLQYQIEMLFDEIRNSGNEGGDVTGCEHSYVETRVNATCTADGYTEYRCTICGDAYIVITELAFGHSYLNGACENCGEVENGNGSDAEFEAYKQNVIREISVQWKELTANLAVTESQYAYYDKYMITLESAQTAEEVANLQYQIEMLFDEIRNSGNEGGDVTGCEHSYEEIRVNATCTADGYTEYRCTICGDAYTEFTEPAFGHSYLNGACENCGEKQDGEIIEPVEKEVLYRYSDETLTLTLYSNGALEYTQMQYTADGVVNKVSGEGQWYSDEASGYIYAYVDDVVMAFVVNENGGLTLAA